MGSLLVEVLYVRGFNEFGEVQADAYIDKLFAQFDEIALHPYAFQSVDALRVGYRRCVCGVDSIYYRIVDEQVDIMRILGRQDALSYLDEDL
jgi:toxin ParE1/3/4